MAFWQTRDWIHETLQTVRGDSPLSIPTDTGHVSFLGGSDIRRRGIDRCRGPQGASALDGPDDILGLVRIASVANDVGGNGVTRCHLVSDDAQAAGVRRVGILLFGTFLTFALARLLLGAKTCGCFGVLEVHPLWTVILDATCLVVLTRTQPMTTVAPWQLFTGETIIPVLTLTMVVVPFSLVSLRPVGSSLSHGGLTVRPGELVVLEPEAWIGQRCPILDHIETRERLGDGRTLLVLVRHGCPICEEKIPAYRALANSNRARVALIEVPSQGPGLEQVVVGRLRADIDWFVETPAELVLEDGIVRQALHNSNAPQQFTRHLASVGEPST